MTTFTGTDGDDVFKGKGQDDIFNMDQGGNDTVSGGKGDDTFDFGATFTADDRVSGGAGSDSLELTGDYSAGLVFGATSLTQVEEIDLNGRFNYSLTMDDANVAKGQTLSIDASDLGAGNKVVFNGSHETNGSFDVTVRFAHAKLIGGAGADTFTLGEKLGSSGHNQGGGGAVLTGGGGADHFVFLSLGQTGIKPNEITDLTSADTIDLKNIDADSKTVGDQAFKLVATLDHHAGEAALSFDVDTGKTSLLLDTNGDGAADYTIVLDGDQTGFTHFVL